MVSTKRYEFQKLWYPLICAHHGKVWVAHVEDIDDVDVLPNGEQEEYTRRRFTCAATGCKLLLTEIRI